MNNQFYKLKVKHIVNETPDCVTLFFDHPEEKRLEYKPGQFLTFILQLEDEEIRRAYSLCTSSYIDKHLAVTVKRVPGGKASNFLNEVIKVGDVLKVMEPMGDFTTDFNINNQRHLVLFGGGSGITPLISLIKTTLVLEPQSHVSLIYANRDLSSIIFKRALDNLKAEYPHNFEVIYILDVAHEGWPGLSGFLTPEIIKSILVGLPTFSDMEYFICGPAPMMTIISETLASLNISEDAIHKERFAGTAGSGASNKSAEKPEIQGIVVKDVRIIYNGEQFDFRVPPDKTILETAIDLDIELPYSCQSGLCKTCIGKCLSGEIRMDEEEGLSEIELQQGYVLTCVGHPVTKAVVIEIE